MINVTKIKEECKDYTRIYYKLEQVKTYKPHIVKKIMEQLTFYVNAGGALYGELGHNNGSSEINVQNCTHKIVSIEQKSETDIKITAHVFPEAGLMTKTLHPYLIACVENKTFEIPLSYTLRGWGNENLEDFTIITFDLADENTVGKNPIFVPETLINDIAREQASI